MSLARNYSFHIILNKNERYFLARHSGNVVETTIFDLIAHRADAVSLVCHLLKKENYFV